MADRLKDKVAVVTGAAAGIGLGIASLFAQEGAFVYLTDREGEAAATAAAAINAAGHAAQAIAVDVSRGQDVTALFRAVEKAHGRIDVLVNNAGLNVMSDFRNLTDADWVRIREVNLDGVVRVARDALPLLRQSRTASLVNISSIMGHRGLRPLAAYSATKGAVSALSRGLAVEYAAFNVRVNTLSPGYIETALTSRVLRNPQMNKALLDRTLLKRFGTADDIAKAALFLASEESSYMTGAELVVDGGMMAAL